MDVAAPRSALTFCLEPAVSATSSLDLSVVADREVVRVTPSGEIDLSNRDRLDEQLSELWDGGWRHIVLDLHDVSFLDSSGLQVLVTHHRRAAAAGDRFVLADCSREVARVITLTGLDRVLDCGGQPLAAAAEWIA
jgi:anti-sigma B factor antagonist